MSRSPRASHVRRTGAVAAGATTNPRALAFRSAIVFARSFVGLRLRAATLRQSVPRHTSEDSKGPLRWLIRPRRRGT